MRFNTFIFTLRSGVANIWKNKLFSLISIATMAACIFLFGLFFAIISNFQNVVKNVESEVAITVLFNDDITDEQITAIGELIRQRPEVADYKYTNADEAWQKFIDDYLGDSVELGDTFEDDNPLANSTSYTVYLKDVSQQEQLVEYLETIPGVREINRSELAANTLMDFNRLLTYVSGGIIIILICAAIFLISNTVTVGITVRSEEIGIMKMIGATDFLVRAPFVIEGILIGIIGSVIPLFILYELYIRVIAYIGDNFAFLQRMLNFMSARSIFEVLVPIALILGVGVGYIGSFFTVRKHLRV